MASSPTNVPRWAPSPCPIRSSTPNKKRFIEDNDDPMKDKYSSQSESSFAYHEDDESMENIFPFSTCSHQANNKVINYSVHEDIYDAPSLRIDDESADAIKMNSSLMEMEPVDHQLLSVLNNQHGSSSRRSSDSWGDSNTIISLQRLQSEGVFLTWEDLWVTVPSGSKDYRPIIQGLTGYAQPGEILAIMGPSGCGKSTLLDALAGRLASNTRQSGEIQVNGRRQRIAFGTSAYVTQDDTLMTTLTVKEAVNFSAQLQLPDSMTRSEKNERAETTIREMGLQEAMNTRIGGWSIKGLSGGQRRRVSICIEILTRPKLLFLDEPTSGLDSAASYHVMNRIVRLSRQYGMTVLASIHQPSSEVFDLFHNLCLLSSGSAIYFGPASAANEFFALNGFPCPTMRNPSDHYLRTINKDFDQDIEQGSGGKPTTTDEAINILVKSYKSSQIFHQVKQRVSEICKREGRVLEKGSQASFITQSLVLTRRSFVNMYRDLGYYWLRLAIYIALCLCVGTIFYDIGHSFGSIQARGSMLMFVAAFLTFMAIGGFPSFVEDMKIFGRERLNGHYGVAAFVMGNTLSSIPYLLLISLIPGAIAYYLVGLQKGIEHFVFFALLLFMCMMLVESLMMIVASIVPDFLMGIITGAGIQGVMMLNGGFFRLPNDLPKPFWRYPFYFIAFHRYANEGFYKNEFEGLNFPNGQVGGSSTISGEEILRKIWQMEMGYSKWVDLAILFGMVVLYRLMFFGIIKMSEKLKPIIRAFLISSSLMEMKPVDHHQLSSVNNHHGSRSIGGSGSWREILKREGVFLTWEDLWVTVPSGSKDYKPIIQGLTGYAQPGEILAIMGPSGCGKSTLLDALAGRLAPNTRQSGDILINGRRQRLAFGTSAYVTQDDMLMTTLTVKEAVYYSAQLQLPDSMTKAEKKDRAETTIREMGLQEVMNTRIGGWSSKGLSGGQMRRVSICIEILTCPKLLFLDEPTSGLDSAASYHVMNRILRLSRQYGMTVLASIHQPSSEVFDLFHNLCLLSSGRTIYYGPASAANEFFALNGFPCPTMRNPSDHYLRTINNDFDQDIEQGSGGKPTTTEEAIDILVKSYKASQIFQQVKRRVSEICTREGRALEKGSQASFITQSLVLTRRSFVNMYRDLGYYWLRLAINISLCLCVGTIFYDIGHSYGSIQARGAMLMFVGTFLTFMAIGGFPSFVEDMKIFGQERLNGHYGVSAFVIGNTLSSIPYLLLISVIPGAIAYYLVGLQKGLEHFLFFALIVLACMMLVESLMMIVASIVPDFLMGIITGAGIQGVMMLNGGFLRLPNDLPKPFWRYPFYFIAFHRYANEGFYKNEFEGLNFPNGQVGGSSTISGEEILRKIWQMEMGYSKWVDLAILFGMVVLYRLMFFGIIKMSEKLKPIIRAFLVVSPKQTKQIMENPSTTPSH
ncbi:ABC transporter-like [Macleaya cordata]|uniref:ABC transporter-like n=1 Tax=Macleaya cordata TaxID=56857 RepID=A0A200QYY8_MACCD|nr:ABC transporter-like [Macleaya cordata]